MARQRTHLVVSEKEREEIEALYRQTDDRRVRERVQVVRLACGGKLTQSEIALEAGCVRSSVQNWLNAYQSGGLKKLIARGKPGASFSPLQNPEVQEKMVAQLQTGEFRTAGQLARWLEATFGIRRAVPSLYYWLKNMGAALRVPRPVNRKQDPQAAAAFLAGLEAKLSALPLEKGRPVRIWVQDEGRFGLHTIVRRCWALKGLRVVKKTQRKYQWVWVYGALEIGTGRCHCLWLPNVDLDISKSYLESLAQLEPEAEHVVIWDGAGFHQKAGVHELPPHVHVLQLPAYSPELNPVEKLWDVLKDGLCNRVFDTLEHLWEAFLHELTPFYQAERVHRLLGQHSILAPANASSTAY